jgi:hypothetical protein
VTWSKFSLDKITGEDAAADVVTWSTNVTKNSTATGAYVFEYPVILRLIYTLANMGGKAFYGIVWEDYVYRIGEGV